ncbi:MAG TPA: CHRD domain-containing protein, partial [Anaerolineales bacterium]|nr:CHRD domain-containing protein [Anaerolineales bacterium]
MKKTFVTVIVVLTLLITTTVAYASPQDQRNFAVPLSGAAERPTPVDTNARGVAIFHLSKDGTELSYKLIVANIDDIVQAHIHC